MNLEKPKQRSQEKHSDVVMLIEKYEMEWFPERDNYIEEGYTARSYSEEVDFYINYEAFL